MENKPKINTNNKIKKLTKIQEFLKLNLLLLLLFSLSLSLNSLQGSRNLYKRKSVHNPLTKYSNLSIKQDQKANKILIG